VLTDGDALRLNLSIGRKTRAVASSIGTANHQEKFPMPTIKHIAISFLATAVAVAVIFRVPAVRKIVTGA
jgi:hypothetical protein